MPFSCIVAEKAIGCLHIEKGKEAGKGENEPGN